MILVNIFSNEIKITMNNMQIVSMLFRLPSGELKELNRYDCKNDQLYYAKLMEIFKLRVENVNEVNEKTSTIEAFTKPVTPKCLQTMA